MLEELHIVNYALIDELSVSFHPGLNILTGETGAGKSILIGALGLLLGGRGESAVIRTGTTEASVSGTLVVSGNPEACAWLAERDIKPEEERVIIRRTLKENGRGSIYIQSAPVARSDLQAFTSCMFDIHGQHEHQSLLNLENHRKVLDRYGGLEDRTVQLGRSFVELSGQKKTYEGLMAEEAQRLREIDLLDFAVKEIDAARLTEGEEEELRQEKTFLTQHEKLMGYLENFGSFMYESRMSAVPLLGQARTVLGSLSAIDQTLAPLEKRLDTVYYEAEDIAASVRKYHASADFSPERLEACEERLALIHKLGKKYGSSIREILAYRKQSTEKLSAMGNRERELADLKLSIDSLEKKVLALALELSRERKAIAMRFAGAVQDILVTLGMPKAVFHADVRQRESGRGTPVCGPYGIDTVEFTISPNLGEPPKPLKDVASGGELSRIMLSLKTVLARSDDIGSLVFDEIDAGIGGEVALAVGRHMKELSKYKQVLCITHLASIAVRADNHLKVEKKILDNRTRTEVVRIANEQKVREIARMLAGD
ncbi:MAG: DNA repair protein RecN, partial [Spirochaetales bacterium]